MPQLMVNLDDIADCQKGMEILRRRIARGGCQPRGGRRNFQERMGTEAEVVSSPLAEARGAGMELPLPQKLKRIQSRGMWKHLLQIAKSAEQPLSLPELDSLLDMPKNKMRSLKAIMAKLENRFDLQFLKVVPDAGVDAAGNPRYIMLPNVRRQILKLASV